MNGKLPKLDNANLWDKTYVLLKDRIMRREFSPQQKLSIPELSEQLGVSRTPIRDALVRLEMDGLVRTVSKVGTFVVGIDADSLRDIMDTRLMLELWAVEKMESIPETLLQETVLTMEGICGAASELAEASSVGQYLEADYNLDFHLAFMSLGQNAKNLEIYRQLMNYRYLASNVSLITKEMIITAQAQHMRIVDALRKAHISEIREAVTEHLYDARDRLLAKLEANGGVL